VKNIDDTEAGATFEAVYCLKKRINPSRFEHRLLGDGVMILFRPLVSFLCLVFPSVFRGELENLTSLGQVRNRRDFVSEMRVITDFNDYQLPLWRSMLGLRISTRRLSRLRELFPKSDSSSSRRSRSKENALGASLND
jgi:hypothetical protein